MNDGVTLNGRALARNGAVTLINDTITAARCATGGGSAPAAELDVAHALPADPGIGANQGLRPNHAVEQALVEAGVDPTRANWSKSTLEQVDLEQVDVEQVDLVQVHLVDRRKRHGRAVGAHDLDLRHTAERRRARRR